MVFSKRYNYSDRNFFIYVCFMTLYMSVTDEIWKCRPRIVCFQPALWAAARIILRIPKWTNVSETNSTIATLSDKFWVQTLQHNLQYKGLHNNACTAVHVRTLAAYQSPETLSSSNGCIRWPVCAGSVYQETIGPREFYNTCPTSIYILFSRSPIYRLKMLKTELFNWRRIT